jgi:hypothetical protein
MPGNSAVIQPRAVAGITGIGGGSSNVALASAGAVATASSSYGAAYPVSAVNNNERAGSGWGNGGGWNDASADQYPDWVQIQFSGSKTVDRVVVYTVQDNYGNPTEPTDTQTFSLYGVTAFEVQGWNGSSWVVLASVSGNNLVKRTVSFAAYTTDRMRVNVTAALSSYSRITEIEAWGTTATGLPSTSTGLASSANPAVAGTSVTFTATVTGSNPTGTVGFASDGSGISGCSAVTLAGSGNSRSAICTTSALSVGTHSIVASYAGDAGNAPSSSPALSQGITGIGGGSSNVALASAGRSGDRVEQLRRGLPGIGGEQQRAGGQRLGKRRRLERCQRGPVSGLGADPVQRIEDGRSSRRLHGAGQLRQPDRADGHADVQLVRITAFDGAGLERLELGVTLASVSEQQSGEADGDASRHSPPIAFGST